MTRAYADAVDERLAALYAAGHRDFRSLVSGARGTDPLDVAAWLRRMPVRKPAPKPAPKPEPEPEPALHPLRCEWYFTSACARALAERFGAGRLLALGVPTVAAAANDAVLVEGDATLVRARFGRTSALVELDLGNAAALPEDGELAGTFDAALLDPPWYPPHPLRWLALAASRVRTGGTLAMVLPPELQRPTATEERHAALELAERLGPTTIETDAVRYATPRFERIAMARAGLSLPPAWRRADLLVARVERPDAELPLASPVSSGFESFVIGRQVVLLRTRARPGRPALHPVEGTRAFEWDRISTRDPRVSTIDVWTSESRVARVTGRDELAALLRRLESGSTPADVTDDRTLAADLGRLLVSEPRPPGR